MCTSDAIILLPILVPVHPVVLSCPVISSVSMTRLIIVAIVASRLSCWHLHFVDWDRGWWQFLPRADRPGIIVVILRKKEAQGGIREAKCSSTRRDGPAARGGAHEERRDSLSEEYER